MISREEAILILHDMLNSCIDGHTNLLAEDKEVPAMLIDDINALDMAIEALKQTADKDCSRCVMRNSCLVKHEFKYMDYCQDWSEADD